MSQRRKISGDQLRRMTFVPKTLDDEAGTVEAVFATETAVRRWFGNEVILCTADAVDLSRFGGAPVLDSHNRSSIGAIVGVVESVRIQDRKLVGKFRFSESPEGQAAKQKVAEGVIRSVSVGYTIIDHTESRGKDGDTEVVVTKWRPFEISLVGVPADPNAKIRSKEIDMDEDLETAGEANEMKRSRRREGQREKRTMRLIADIRSIAVDSGLAAADVDEMLEDCRSVDEARAAVWDALVQKTNTVRTEPGRHISHSNQEDETRTRAIDAIAVRLGAQPSTAAANPLAGQSLTSIMRTLMEAGGVSTRNLDDRQVVERSLGGDAWTRGHTTSDFPALLVEAGQRALMARFGAELTPIKRLSVMRNARDFRPQSFIRPGEAPKLEKLSESGEIRRGTLAEEKEGFEIETYARIFGLSRKAIVNDDLGGFADFLMAFAQSAATTEGDLFYNLISANAFGGVKLSDGKNLFHADHGNLAAAGAAPSVTTLSAAREAMRLQKNVNGTGRAGAVPGVILVGPKLETVAEQLVASLSPAQLAEVNPFSGKLRVEVETRYEGAGWWVFADPASQPTFMHGYLDGAEGPQIDTREGWDVPGTEFRCMLDFGCGVYDWRAAYFNPGQ